MMMWWWIVLWALALAVLGGVVLRHAHARRRRLAAALHAPLLPSAEIHRLDAALKDANEGFNVCRSCAFENFKRMLFCTLCGDAIDHHDKTTAVASSTTPTATRRSTPRRLDSWRRTRRRQSSHDLEAFIITIDAPASPPLATPTSRRSAEALLAQQALRRNRRQRRARRRREWQRRAIPAEGSAARRLVWARDPSAHGRFPGFVFEITGSPRRAGLDKVPAVPADAEDAPVGTLPVEPRTVEERATALREEWQATTWRLVDADQADPSRLPMTETVLTGSERTEVLQLFQRDFPSKYAQFVTSTAAVLVPADVAHLRLHIHRERVYRESIDSFGVIRTPHMRSAMRINFVGESGIDAGGVHREWFMLLLDKVLDPTTGLFRCVDKGEQCYYLNPHSRECLGEHHLVHFFAVGRLLGRALLEGCATGLHLALPLLKIILGLPVSLDDLEFFDPETYKSMLWVAEHEEIGELGLDFTVCDQAGGKVVVSELAPGGAEVAVTDENKMFYLERKLQVLLFESVSEQLFAFLKGIYEVVPPEVLMILDPEELDYVLCGSDEIDVDDWERNTKYTEDLHDHPAMRWFWEIVREMPNEYRRRLLLFSTGSSRVPLAGFHALTSYDGRVCPFTLNGIKLIDEGYIISHACFNRLDLPRHVNRDELRTVLYATLSTDLYGFTSD